MDSPGWSGVCPDPSTLCLPPVPDDAGIGDLRVACPPSSLTLSRTLTGPNGQHVPAPARENVALVLHGVPH